MITYYTTSFLGWSGQLLFFVVWLTAGVVTLIVYDGAA